LGVLDLGRPDTRLDERSPGQVYGGVEEWVKEISHFYREYHLDTFIFWPVAGNELVQIEVFAKEVVPEARRVIGV
jgi:hypothetical protein